MIGSGLAILLTLAAQPEVLSLSEVRARALSAATGSAAPVIAETRLEEVRATRRPVIAGRVEVSAAPGGEFFDVQSESGERVRVSAVNAFEDGLEGFEPVLRYGADLGLDWLAYDFGRTGASIDAAEAEARAARLDAALARADFIEAVDIAYLGWLSAWAELELVRQRLERAEGRAEASRLEEAAGAVARDEVRKAELGVLAAKLRRVEAEDALAAARRQLEGTGGFDVPARAVPDVEWLSAPSVDDADAPARTDALTARLAAAEARAEAAHRERRASLRAEAAAGVRGQFGTISPVYRGGLQLRVPVTDGGARQARRRRAEAEADALRVKLQSALAAEARSARSLSASMSRAQARVELARRYLELAMQGLESAEAEAGSPEGEAQIARAWTQVDQARSALLAARVARAERMLAQSRSSASSASTPTSP